MKPARTKPTPSVKIASFLFTVAGIVLFLGLIKSFSEIPFQRGTYNIFLVYVFLFLLCFFIAFGLYRHKKWSLYIGLAFGLYLVVNFFINMGSNFAADIMVAGSPILVAAVVVIGILLHKHKHFIH